MATSTAADPPSAGPPSADEAAATEAARLRRRMAWGAAIIVVCAAIALAVALPGHWSQLLRRGTASQIGGQEVITLSGIHVVHHNTAPLPSEQFRRDDGRATLVWFSATWCTTCGAMEPYALDTLARYQDRTAIIEKSVDHDPAAVIRYRIRGTPTFLLIDATGNELARFTAVTGERDFTAAIEAALRKAGL